MQEPTAHGLSVDKNNTPTIDSDFLMPFKAVENINVVQSTKTNRTTHEQQQFELCSRRILLYTHTQ